MKPTFSMLGHPIGKVNRFLLRFAAYTGLYAEIFSASCRWLSKPNCWGERKPWRTAVTQSLVATEYLPPTREEAEAAQAQRRINGEHEALVWIGEQPETIQTCLKINQRALAALRLQKYDPNQYLLVMDSPPGPAIPVYQKMSDEEWYRVTEKIQ